MADSNGRRVLSDQNNLSMPMILNEGITRRTTGDRLSRSARLDVTAMENSRRYLLPRTNVPAAMYAVRLEPRDMIHQYVIEKNKKTTQELAFQDAWRSGVPS